MPRRGNARYGSRKPDGWPCAGLAARRTCPSGQRITGPAVIEEEASTTVVPPDDTAEIDAGGNIVITLGAAS